MTFISIVIYIQLIAHHFTRFFTETRIMEVGLKQQRLSRLVVLLQGRDQSAGE